MPRAFRMKKSDERNRFRGTGPSERLTEKWIPARVWTGRKERRYESDKWEGRIAIRSRTAKRARIKKGLRKKERETTTAEDFL